MSSFESYFELFNIQEEFYNVKLSSRYTTAYIYIYIGILYMCIFAKHVSDMTGSQKIMQVETTIFLVMTKCVFINFQNIYIVRSSEEKNC